MGDWKLNRTENTCSGLGVIREPFLESHRALNSNAPEYTGRRTGPRSGSGGGGPSVYSQEVG